MDDWEEELEQVTEGMIEGISLTTDKKAIELESEDLIREKKEYIAPVPQEKNDDPYGYNKKWEEKNKEIIERRKKDELAVEGLDEKDRQKKLIDMRVLGDVTDFMGAARPTKKDMGLDEKENPLISEKDFIDLAISNVSKVKAANRPSKFTFSYLKNSLDLLAPTLDGDKLDQLIKDLTVLFNKKIKGDKVVKPTPGKAKPSVVVGKGLERAEKFGAIEDYGGKDDMADEDYYEDDFI